MCFELATFGNALGVRADFIPEHLSKLGIINHLDLKGIQNGT